MKDLRCDPEFFALLSGSYLRLVGSPLIPQGLQDPAGWLYEQAPFCVLAHNTDPDPRFIYANRVALACFEYTWAELISLPSRLSAEAPAQEERRRLLNEVLRRGYASGYAGLRISRTGRRFRIEDGTVWQLLGEDGVVHGQAATFPRWRDA